MNQAILLSIANETWTQPPTNKRNDDEALKEWLNKAVFPYLSNIKIYNAGEYSHPKYNLRNWHGIRFSDGSMMTFHNNNQIFVYYDINGSTGPNKAGNDIFVFFMDYSENQASGRLGRFYPAGYIWDNGDRYVYNSRDMMKHYCNPKNLHRADENTCALLIMQDGWRVAKDYPVKLK